MTLLQIVSMYSILMTLSKKLKLMEITPKVNSKESKMSNQAF